MSRKAAETNKKTFLTPEGRKKIEEELEHLRNVRRPQVVERIREAKEEGEVLENAEYDDAKNEQAFVEGRIAELEAILANFVLIKKEKGSDTVGLGSQVTVLEDGREQVTYQIVGSAEVDPKTGRISNESPLGQALLGHRAGEEVTFRTPGGTVQVKIIKVL
ncbi:MAG: transcription elongation factor GreA [Chloroflexi bacterium]|nr:transcription elongation factor GreA [Chloroflexota bacterium]